MLNLKELEIATGGKIINGNEKIIPKYYELDSRSLKEDDFFIPLKGEKVDSHEYILDCVSKGAIGFFISKNYSDKEKIIKNSIKINNNICIVEVDDTKEALIKSGKYNRSKHIDIPIVAVTGSVGKTSTRQMIASVLKEEKNVLVTEKNYNSNIGVSIMCLQIENQDVCVFEAGIDKFGEMEELSEIIKPDVVVFTVIGTSHIGTFLTKENIFNEKTKLLDNIKGLKKVIANGDDEYLSKLSPNKNYDVEKYSIDNVGEIKQGQDFLEFETSIYGSKEKLKINDIGNHNIYNALCAIKVGQIFNLKKESIINGISSYTNYKGRLKRIEVNGIVLIDDSYNASNESMRSGLITVNHLDSKRKIAVLGDMFDLGEMSDVIHIKLADVFKIVNYDYLFTLGNQAKKMAKAAEKYMNKKNIITFDDREDLIEKILEIAKKGDIFYFKASNGMKFSSIVKDVEKKL